MEFRGYISGDAASHFWKASRKIGFFSLFFAICLLTPVIVVISVALRDWRILTAFVIIALLILLAVYIPKSQKEKQTLLPKRIYIEDEYIVAVADKYIESKKICDVKKVIDHGSFYELVFSFGNASEKFLCQKNLLINGNINEFELLFSKKIIRK